MDIQSQKITLLRQRGAVVLEDDRAIRELWLETLALDLGIPEEKIGLYRTKSELLAALNSGELRHSPVAIILDEVVPDGSLTQLAQFTGSGAYIPGNLKVNYSTGENYKPAGNTVRPQSRLEVFWDTLNLGRGISKTLGGDAGIVIASCHDMPQGVNLLQGEKYVVKGGPNFHIDDFLSAVLEVTPPFPTVNEANSK